MSITNWIAESLRISLFPSAEKYATTAWWEQVGEATPDIFTQQKTGIVHVAGAYRSGSLVLTSDQVRIDWVYSVYPLREEIKEVPSLGPFLSELTPFVQGISKWLNGEGVPSCNRIAFGCVLLLPVENRKVGYEILNKHLTGLNVDAEGSTDLIYQINKRRWSKIIKDMEVNRLSKWSVSDLRFTRGEDKKVVWEQHACRLELDINNVLQEKEFQRQEIAQIIDEFLQLGIEISENGDIK